jgi:hypothetical protein
MSVWKCDCPDRRRSAIRDLPFRDREIVRSTCLSTVLFARRSAEGDQTFDHRSHIGLLHRREEMLNWCALTPPEFAGVTRCRVR